MSKLVASHGPLTTFKYIVELTPKVDPNTILQRLRAHAAGQPKPEGSYVSTDDIRKWLEENCSGECKVVGERFGGAILFEREPDYAKFLLTYG